MQFASTVTVGTVNAGARLDRLPIAGFHWRMLGLIGAGAALDAFDIYLAAGVGAAMIKQGFSTLPQNATFFSATFVGMLIGSGLAGYVGDRFGRRYSYQFNLMVFGLASLAACFAPNIQVLTALRLIMGIGLGAELVVATGTLCEFIPPAYRGRWSGLLSIFTNSGLFIASGVGYLVIPSFGWRPMFAIAGVGALIVWALRKRMPESPRWLETVGRHAEAEATLQAIEAEIGAKRTLPPPLRVRAQESRSTPLSALFGRTMLGRTITACLIFAAINMAVYGFVAWLPTFMIRQGLSIVQSLWFTTIMSLGSTTGAVIGIVVADRFPRRWSLVMTCLAIMALGIIYPMMRDPVTVAATGFALVSAIYTLVTIGFYCYTPELFPTAYRLRGTGVAGMAGRAASIATPFLAVALFESFGVQGVLALVSCMLVTVIVAVLWLRVETVGRSLDDSGELFLPGTGAAFAPQEARRRT